MINNIFLCKLSISNNFKDMAVELPPLLKAIGYPGTVSKSTFQTIGATHSWPMTIGVLHYLYVKAKVLSEN